MGNKNRKKEKKPKEGKIKWKKVTTITNGNTLKSFYYNVLDELDAAIVMCQETHIKDDDEIA